MRCTQKYHNHLKCNVQRFRKATTFAFMQDVGDEIIEFRNCTRCGSSLTLPKEKS